MLAPELPGWAAQYIGIPYADLGQDRRGANCWGLIRLIMAEQAGIDLPWFDGYDGTEARDAESIASIVTREQGVGDWVPVKAGSERMFDGILLDWFGLPMHTGLVLAPGVGIHTLSGNRRGPGPGSRVIYYRLPKHKHILAGFYRHKALA